MKKKEIAEAVQRGFTQPMEAAPAPAPEVAPEKDTEGSTQLEYLKPTPDMNPRNQALKEIAARANADADRDAAETVTVTDDDGNVVTPQAAEPAVEEPAAEPTEQETPAVAPEAHPEMGSEPAQAAPAQAAIDPNAEYEIQVDGVPTKIKGSSILSRVQKDSAAEYRLQLATQTLEEARRQAAAMQTQPTPPGAAMTPATPAATPESTLSDKELAEMLQFGGPEQAVKAVAELRRRQAPAVTLDDVKKLLAEETPRITSHEMAFQEATRFAKTEYADLLADPYLARLFYTEENRLREAGNNKPYGDLYREIGDGLRKHFNRPKPTGANPSAQTPTKPAAPAAPTAAQRQAAKAAAPAAPRLASARLDGGEAKAPKTREQIIRGMQESRGQRPVNA